MGAAKKNSSPPAAKQQPPTQAEIKTWRAASTRLHVRIELLTQDGVEAYGENDTIPAGCWYAVVPTVPSVHRYQFVLQWQGATKKFVLSQLIDGVGAARLPAKGGWIRALVEGKLHVIASDLRLTRRQLAAIIGGHEPPAGKAVPPNT